VFGGVQTASRVEAARFQLLDHRVFHQDLQRLRFELRREWAVEVKLADIGGDGARDEDISDTQVRSLSARLLLGAENINVGRDQWLHPINSSKQTPGARSSIRASS
jgi:hypothetical protein